MVVLAATVAAALETTTATSSDDRQKAVIVGPDLNPSKAPLDKKVYRQILLQNGLRAVLISDVAAMNQIQSDGGGRMYNDDDDDDDEEEEETPLQEDSEDDDDDDEKSGGEAPWLRDAAAALTVGVGSFSDPSDCQGLAHFLEHLLFMGSAKYPEENDYDVYMSKHGGSDNAYTESEATTYHFSIPQEFLKGALDRLAQFFIEPLLLPSGVDRELKAIESEYQLNKQDDHVRLQQLWSETCQNKHHPFAQFQWGNIKSLKEIPEQLNVDPMLRLRNFFNQVS
jgi:nardilysin